MAENINIIKGMAVHGEDVKLTVGSTVVYLREVPEFSKPAKEKIDVTCLNDKEMRYIAGIGDSISELTFKTLYDTTLYQTLAGLENGDSEGNDNKYVLTLSDGCRFEFEGKHTMTYHGGGLNTAAEMSIVISLSSAPAFKTAE